jgi:hypothetical protein
MSVFSYVAPNIVNMISALLCAQFSPSQQKICYVSDTFTMSSFKIRRLYDSLQPCCNLKYQDAHSDATVDNLAYVHIAFSVQNDSCDNIRKTGTPYIRKTGTPFTQQPEDLKISLSKICY